jgi:chorismate synthase
METAKTDFYRSDIQAVTAASVVVESVVALEIASSML